MQLLSSFSVMSDLILIFVSSELKDLLTTRRAIATTSNLVDKVCYKRVALIGDLDIFYKKVGPCGRE